MENKSRMHKQGIRSKYLGYRDALGAEVRLQKSMQIWENIRKQPEFQEAENVLVYMDYRSEVMTTGLVEEMFLSEAPKHVFAPVVEGMTISFYEIRSLSDLHAGYQDIREPQEDKEKLFTEEIAGQKTLVLVPGSVFDRSGKEIEAYWIILGDVKPFAVMQVAEVNNHVFLASSHNDRSPQ